MSRRVRRRLGIVLLLVLMLGTQTVQNALTSSHAAPSGRASVAIARVEGDVSAAVRQAVVWAGGLSSVISPGDVVVVKPNLVMDASAGSGMVTDPAVVRAVVQLAWEAGASQVIIAEGTAQYRDDPNRDRFCTQAAFQSAGYDLDGDMVDDVTGVPLVDLNDSGGTDVADPAKVTRVTLPNGLIRTEYWIPNIVLHADVLIDVPVLKNHFLAGVTLGMKNLFGILPNDLYHGPGTIYGKHSLAHGPIDLDRHIVDVNLARRPDFVVVDGQRGMIDGPIGSQIIHPPMGVIIAGQDVVAVDTIGALVMGYDPQSIPYLGLAAQSGLGTTDVARIHVTGIPVDQVRREFPAPYADSAVQRADAQPPTLTFVTPVEGELTGPMLVTVDVQDEALARVEFYIDEEWLGESPVPPFQFSLDPGLYPPGAHVLRAVAYDRYMNRAEATLSIQIAVPTPTATPVPPATATSTPSTSTPLPPSPTPSPSHTETPSTMLPTERSTTVVSLSPPSPTVIPTSSPTATVRRVATPTFGTSPTSASTTLPPMASPNPRPIRFLLLGLFSILCGTLVGAVVLLVIWRRR